MLQSYLKIALRNLRKHTGYTFINVFGLALGLACCLVILLIVRHELSFDDYHSEADRLYRVNQDVRWSDEVWPVTGAPMGPNLSNDFAEVEQSARIHIKSTLVAAEGPGGPVRAQEHNVAFADAALLGLFALPLRAGDAATALDAPNAVLLTEPMARKYFGTADPLGRTLRLDNTLDLTVTGVLAPLPTNTHLAFDIVAAFPALHQVYGTPVFTSWWWPAVATYVRLAPGADVAALNAESLPAFIKRYREPDVAEGVVPQLQAVPDIHLFGLGEEAGSIRYVYIFSAIALFVLLIACVNFMNLATARSASRAREVGVRKAVGASRGQLIGQFLGESVFMTLLALLCAFGLTELALPVLNQITGLGLSVVGSGAAFWGGVGVLAMTVGVLSGSYPALLLSAFRPVAVLKGGRAARRGDRGLRSGLVVLQFAISIALIAATLVVYRQFDYLRSQSLGFAQSQLIALPTEGDSAVIQGYEALKPHLAQVAGVTGVTGTNWLPGAGGGAFMPTMLEGLGEGLGGTARVLYVEADFLETLGIEVVEGRGFSTTLATEATQTFLINGAARRWLEAEAARQGLPLDALLGQTLRVSYGEFGQVVYEKSGTLAGITADFHLDDLRQPIGPTLMTVATEAERARFQYVLVRLAGGNARAPLAAIEAAWNAQFPHRPLEPIFLDQRLAAAYQLEVQFGQIMGAFALLAVLIACLGLFGLAAFTAEQRTKEIGIRKVLGATTPGLMLLLSKEFTRLVLVAVVLAVPVAYFGMRHWLDDFAYRIELHAGFFVVAGLAAFVIAWLTVGYQALKAARANPIDALQYE